MLSSQRIPYECLQAELVYPLPGTPMVLIKLISLIWCLSHYNETIFLHLCIPSLLANAESCKF